VKKKSLTQMQTDARRCTQIMDRLNELSGDVIGGTPQLEIKRIAQ
jgi:hypothetical protein